MAKLLTTIYLGLEYAKRFTESYKKGTSLDIFTREQMCEDLQFPAVLVSPREGDLLCGKRGYPEVGYSPQYGGMGYYFDPSSWEGPSAAVHYTEEELKEWRVLKAFWESESTENKCRQRFSPLVKERLSRPFEEVPHENAGYGHYRMSGLQLDYRLLVEEGLEGLRSRIQQKMGDSSPEKAPFYRGLLASVDRVRRMLIHYRSEAAGLSSKPKRERMMAALDGLLSHAPRTFHEALQLILLVQTMTGTLNFGRLDTVLGPFLQRDLEEERLEWEQAGKLLQNFYTIIEEEILHFDGRIIVGGKGRLNEKAADLFAKLALETTDRLSLPMPQLTLRFYEGQDPELLDKAYEVIGHGKTFPILYNDEVNIPAVMEAFQIEEAEAEQYIPFGCGEYMLNHRSSDTPNFFVNLQMCLEFAMNHGRSISTGKSWSPDYGSLTEFEGFDALWEAYSKTVLYYLEAGIRFQETTYSVTAEDCPFSLISLLYDDCLSRGKPIFSGGVRYLGGTNETYGNNNAADSLTAIKELVFQKKKYSGRRLLKALKADWVGDEQMQQDFKEAPHFGNDHHYADAMVQRVDKHIGLCTSKMAENSFLHHFLVVIINNNFNTIWGQATAASPDGRRFGEPLAPGNAPSAGADRNGLTALLNSQAKPSLGCHAGAVQNVKISSSFPQKNPELYRALFRGYFRQGGAQVMISVTNRQDLLAALKYPEHYANLLVRVGGFSARFIDLDPQTQQEILSRTEHQG